MLLLLEKRKTASGLNSDLTLKIIVSHKDVYSVFFSTTSYYSRKRKPSLHKGADKWYVFLLCLFVISLCVLKRERNTQLGADQWSVNGLRSAIGKGMRPAYFQRTSPLSSMAARTAVLALPLGLGKYVLLPNPLDDLLTISWLNTQPTDPSRKEVERNTSNVQECILIMSLN